MAVLAVMALDESGAKALRCGARLQFGQTVTNIVTVAGQGPTRSQVRTRHSKYLPEW